MAEPDCVYVNFAGERLGLLGQRAIWWPVRETLIVADVHLGKGTAFRQLGVPVPSGPSARNLLELSSLLNRHAARRLMILGDFLHARGSRQPEIHASVAQWRAAHAELEVVLVRGNHDRHAGRTLPDWKIVEAEEPLVEGPLYLAHRPDCVANGPLLAGHVHPAVSVRDFDGSSLGVPCFVVEKNCLILPAFGRFTGFYRVSASADRQIFLATGDAVVELKPPASRSSGRQGRG